jgi:ElaB/YqjD/DUF883 family membrane-anchored ribosome-binding protein
MAEETRMNRHEPDREVEALKAEIQETRVAMGQTISAIQERLDPSRLRDQARESVREATIGKVEKMARNVGDRAGDTGRSVFEVVRDNPLPLAMIGVGAGWLFMNRRRNHVHELPRRTGYRTGYETGAFERPPIGYEAGTVPGTYAGAYTGEYARGIEERGIRGREEGAEGHFADRARERASHISDRARDTMHNVEDRARSAADDVTSRVSHMTDTVQDKASHIAHMAEERTRDFRMSAERTMQRAEMKYQETPWMGGVFALALGAAAGLVLPSTRREQELLGSRRDELVDRAREMGHEKMEQARTVASEVASDTRESIREHSREEGLVGGHGTHTGGVGDTGYR